MPSIQVPFYENLSDNTHCFQASMLSVLKYFIPDEHFTMQDLETISGKKPGLATWPQEMILNLIKMGFDVEVIEGFDGHDFASNGEDYLIRAFGAEAAKWMIDNGDIGREQDNYRRLLDSNAKIRTEVPSLKDIKAFIDRGYLVQATVNSRKLNKKPGYVGHSVIIFEYTKDGFYLHDPGLPPVKNRFVNFDEFEKSWADPSETAKNLLAIKLNKKVVKHV